MSDVKKYSNGEVTVRWEAKLCQHAGECVKGCPSVFRPRERPWVNMEGGNSDEIRAAVAKCPSGALSMIENE